MGFHRFFVLLFLTMAFMHSNAQPAQFNFTVKGKITEFQTNTPLEFVNVVIYNSKDSSLVSGAVSQSDGAFSIQINRPGNFYLTADFIGFEKSYISNIVLKPGNESFDAGEVQIKPKTVGIEQVEVVGDKPFVSYKIDRKVIDVSQNPSAQGGTAVDALQNVPSVQTDIEGNITLRGSSNFTVLIDGRQSPLTGTDALNQIPANAIDRIEIITNPSVKYDPDGTAGIINVVTKKGKLTGHSFVLNNSIGTNPMYSSDLTYSYRRKKTTYTASLGYRNFQNTMYSFEDNKTSYYDTLNSLDSVTRLYKDMEGHMMVKNYSIKLGVDYQVTEHNTLTFGGGRNNFSFGRDFGSKINNYYQQPYQTYLLSGTDFLTNPKNWQFNIGDKQIFQNNSEHYLTVDFQYQYFDNYEYSLLDLYNSNNLWEEVSLVDQEQKAETYSLGSHFRTEIAYQLPIPKLFILEAGYTLRIDKNSMDYQQLEKDGPDNLWRHNGEFDDESDFLNYINAGWFLIRGDFRGIQYSAGLRGESTNQTIQTQKDNYNFNYDYLGWYPSLAVTKEWKGGHTLQANYSKRINRPRDWELSPFPQLSDGYSLYLPNPELKPEHAGSYELNYQKSWDKSFVSLETFYRNTVDKMERTHWIEDDTLFVHTRINQGTDMQIGTEFNGNLVLAKWCVLNPKATFYYYKVEGLYDSVLTTKESNTWEAGLTGNFTLPTKTRIQLIAQYRAPEIELEGESKSMYWLSGSVMQGFFEQKLMLILRVDDMFGTRKRIETVYSGNSEVYSERFRKSPTFVLSVNYRFNQNGDKKRNNRNNEENNEGGMDMDF